MGFMHIMWQDTYLHINRAKNFHLCKQNSVGWKGGALGFHEDVSRIIRFLAKGNVNCARFSVQTFGVASSRQVGGGETVDKMTPLLKRREQGWRQLLIRGGFFLPIPV